MPAFSWCPSSIKRVDFGIAIGTCINMNCVIICLGQCSAECSSIQCFVDAPWLTAVVGVSCSIMDLDCMKEKKGHVFYPKSQQKMFLCRKLHLNCFELFLLQ